MNFLIRFLKIWLVSLLLSALGAFVFYKLVMEGKELMPGVSQDDFRRTVGTAIGGWVGFVTALSILLAATGMKKTVYVPVHDRNTFLQRVNAAAASVRYRLQQQGADLLVFKPPAGRLLAEKISARIEGDRAAITAPRGLMRKIQERL